jgi:hypothetical protein
LLYKVNEATNAKFLKKKRAWAFDPNPENDSERYSVDKKKRVITIHQVDRVPISEIVPLVTKSKRVYKFLTNEKEKFTISWTALQEQMANRSVDDLRNMWRLKLYPILEERAGISTNSDPSVANNRWTDK